MKRKKGILFDISGSKEWIGGLYYQRNIVFSILQNKNIFEKYSLVLLVNSKNLELFECFSGYQSVVCISVDNKIHRYIKLMSILLIRNIKYIYNYRHYKFDKLAFLDKKALYWIPDFQDRHYPEFFNEDELLSRYRRINSIIVSNQPIILSSFDAFKDINNYYNVKKNNIFIVPFVSYIEPEIKSISYSYSCKILKKYGLENEKYIFIANQFWQHKNHIIVFKMIKLINECNLVSQYKFVFTGEVTKNINTNDYRLLNRLINDEKIDRKVKILGFIDRKEQLALMKNSRLLIQPSLFEGWGTVLEDAKVLGKQVLLSEIEVHREQKNKNCFLFDPHNEKDLLRVLEEVLINEYVDNIDNGIDDMYARAKEYSKNLEKVFK